MVLTVCARACRVPTGSFRLSVCLDVEGRCGPTYDGFNPNEKDKPTMMMYKTISDDIEPAMRVAIMVGEV